MIGSAFMIVQGYIISGHKPIRLRHWHFSNGDCRDTEGSLRDLTSTFQKTNETPRAFPQRIEDLLTKIRSSVALNCLNNKLNQAARHALNLSHEKIALKPFLAGLSDPLGSIIRSQKPNTLAQAEQFLIEEKNITYLLKKFRNFKTISS
jgi:hypothetical protein